MEQGMNETLKAVGSIGAELGAVKAENEKLRGLLRDLRPVATENGYYRLAARIDAALAAQGGVE
jgi:hypothetical protein